MADTRIGGVYATFRAQNNPWLRASRQNVDALKRQSRATKELRRDASRLRASVRNLIGSLGLLAGGAGLSSLARRTFEAGRNLSALGSTLVENSNRFALTAEQIQLLGRAFEGGGATQEDFIKSFRNLSRNLIDAQAGLVSYRRVFQLVGVDVDKAAEQGLSAYDVFLQLSDGLSKVADQSVRVNVAQTLLGRAGTNLLFELQKGSTALLENAEAFRKFGLITDDQAARLKVLEQSYVNTSTAIRTAQARIVADNAALFESFNRFVATNVPELFSDLIGVLDGLRRHFTLISRAFGIFFGFLLLKTPIVGFVLSLGRAAAALVTLRFTAAAATTAVRFLSKALLIGFIIEGIFITIDAVRALRMSFGSLSDVADIVAISYLQAFSDIANGLRSLEHILRLGIGEALPAVDYVSLYFSPERQAELREVARRGAEVYSEMFLGLLRDRYANFLRGEGALPELPTPVDVPFAPGSRVQTQARDVARRANEALGAQLPISIGLTRALHDRVRAAQQELDLLRAGAGETDRRRIQAEAISDFENAQIALLRERADIEERLGRLRAVHAEVQSVGLFAILPQLEQQIDSEEKRLVLIRSQTAANVELRTEFEKQAGSYAAVLEGIENQKSRVNELRAVYMSVSSAISQFASGAIVNFKSIGDAARDLARTIIDTLIQAFIQAQIQSAIINTIGGTSFGALFGAQGGGVHSGFGIVGEGGPELVDFRRPGRVYTNEELSAALSGSGSPIFNFSPVIQSSDGPAIRRAIGEAFPIFEERVLSRFQSDMRRPSSLRTVTRR